MSRTGKILLWLVALLALAGLVWYVELQGQVTATPSISWTMPGDPKSGGVYARVAGHELRYSTDSALMSTAPATAPAWSPMPPVADRGVKLTIFLPGLVEGSRYWFRYRAIDSAGIFSGWSNQPFKVGGDVTPPETVTDLR